MSEHGYVMVGDTRYEVDGPPEIVDVQEDGILLEVWVERDPDE